MPDGKITGVRTANVAIRCQPRQTLPFSGPRTRLDAVHALHSVCFTRPPVYPIALIRLGTMVAILGMAMTRAIQSRSTMT